MRKERGFTLIEIMIALVLLTVVILGMASAAAQVVHVVAVSDRRTAAIQLAESRVEVVQMDPNYPGLEARYVATEANFPTLPGYQRETQIVHVGGIGQTVDHKKVTVTVTGPGLTQPVSRTITVAAP